ncbi:MAG: tRNA preQ1(34) S-adenosylmethionine ribosyltransferase-isomerase QueA [Alphaproteobacteria bacterium]|nr:tRNA preQ1(34) S-adenosylmethionine ribosyltransferase-isomerase QueA [Alphaproteobacteria bacterium]
MKTALFDFPLPPELIAQEPARPRDSARLLVVDGDLLEDRAIRDLPELLRPDDVMVFNDTRVIPARLDGMRGAARVEVTLHRRAGEGTWLAFAKPAKRLKPGDRIDFAAELSATVEARDGGEVRLAFSAAGEGLAEALDRIGRMPLPPYIRRARLSEDADRQDYQTMFARHAGAVAAPTAGLHFTPALMRALEARGVKAATLTLHVGAGTFLPVNVEDTDRHRMHAEYGEIGAAAAQAINAARDAGGRIVAVGSTALRLMETAAGPDGRLRPFAGETSLFVTPGYRFTTAELMLTNFHLPRSTLFMLVAAFAGLERMRRAYEHAVRARYRFYSYGDACLLRRAAQGAPT